MTALLIDAAPQVLVAPKRRRPDPMVRHLALGRLRTVGLQRLVAEAALLERTDRKYIVPVTTARALVSDLAGTHRVLQIKGRRYTTYESVYFDTDDLSSVHAHIQRRRRRWKVRSRLYVEDELCRVEVKTKDNRGSTVKVMGESDPADFGHLGGDDLDFVKFHLADHSDVQVADLRPSAEVSYTRSTLADLEAGTRVTIDWRLTSRTTMGAASLDSGFVLIETKGPAAPSHADQVLRSLGARPQSFSKYVAAAATTTPRISDNDFRQLVARGVLHVQTGRLAPHLRGVPSRS